VTIAKHLPIRDQHLFAQQDALAKILGGSLFNRLSKLCALRNPLLLFGGQGWAGGKWLGVHLSSHGSSDDKSCRKNDLHLPANEHHEHLSKAALELQEMFDVDAAQNTNSALKGTFLAPEFHASLETSRGRSSTAKLNSPSNRAESIHEIPDGD
jgi:hypothetical protein